MTENLENSLKDVKAVIASVDSAATELPAAVATVEADASKAKADVTAADASLTAWIKSNAGKIALGVIVVGALLVWKLI